MLRTLLFASLLAIMMACGGKSDQTSESGNSPSEIEEVENDASEAEMPEEEAEIPKSVSAPNGKTLALRAAYVTSQAMPHAQNGVQQLFDGDPATMWKTMPGAGPDEGVMLYFDPAQRIDYLQLTPKSSSSDVSAAGVQIYVDGQPYTRHYFSAGNAVPIENEDVNSIFIRFVEVRGMQVVHNDDPGWILANAWEPKAWLGISEIGLLDQNRSPYELVLPKQAQGTATASSTLEPKTAYGVRNLFDARSEFAWVEGADGLGKGTTLTFTFKQPQTISKLRIRNGFQRSPVHFSDNARLKSAEFGNGTITETLQVADRAEEQVLALSTPMTGTTFTLTIGEGYPGAKYKDLCISELTFVGPEGFITMVDAEAEQPKRDLLAQAKGTPLEQLLDRRLNNTVEEMEGYDRSLVLRSDYTFVLYERTWMGEDEEERLADGNWEIREISPTEVKIRIFGKLVDVSRVFDYYAGDFEESFQRIFQDVVTISETTLKGDRFVDEYFILKP